MVVIILQKVTASTRGELSRWLLEPATGVFVGHVSALVRDSLWQKCVKAKGTGGVLLIYSTNTEQRFRMRSAGLTTRQIIEMDGLQLIQIPHDLSKLKNGSIIQTRLDRLATEAIYGGSSE